MTTLWMPLVWTTGTTPRLWDYGVRWSSRRTVAPVLLPVEVAYIRDQVLRVTNGHAEDEFIERAIRSAVETYEHETQRALMLQTWQMMLSGFPSSGWIELVRPPFVEVTTFGYVDGDGADQDLAVSPPDFLTVASGPYSPALIRPLVDASWPSTQTRQDAVTVTYQAGYASADQVPERVITGIALLVAELYKNRGLSVIGTSVSAGQLMTSRFWDRHW